MEERGRDSSQQPGHTDLIRTIGHSSVETQNLEERYKHVLEKLKGLKRHVQICGNGQCRGVLGEPIGIWKNEVVVMGCPEAACRKQWLVCTKCTRQKKPLTSIQKYEKHCDNTHKKDFDNTHNSERSAKRIKTAKSERTLSEPPSADTHLDNNQGYDAGRCDNKGYDTDGFHMEDDCDSIGFDMDESYFPLALTKGDDTAGHQVPRGSLHHEENTKKMIPISNVNQLVFCSKSNEAFFRQEFLHDSGGQFYLVLKSVFKREFHAHDITKQIGKFPYHEVVSRLLLAQFVMKLVPTERNLLVRLMAQLYDSGAESGYSRAIKTVQEDLGENAPVVQTLLNNEYKRGLDATKSVPRVPKHLRQDIVEGKHSIIRNLPTPYIHSDVPGHSYVSVVDCVRDFFGHSRNTSLAFVNGCSTPKSTVRHYTESQRAMECHKLMEKLLLPTYNQSNVLRGLLFVFTDDVEPNNTKSNRGSVWVAVLTIATAAGGGHNTSHTYPLAIGKKGDSHDEVLRRIEEEMKIVRRGFEVYVGCRKRRAVVQFTEFVHLADQPERRGINHLQLGTSNFATRFGVSAHHKECYNVLKACRVCAKENRRLVLHKGGNPPQLPPKCTVCLNWDVFSNDQLALTKPPTDYPLLCSNEEDGGVYEKSKFCRLVRVAEGGRVVQKLKPFRVTYESLIGATKLAYDCFLHHGWSPQNVACYLKVETITTAYINEFQKHANYAFSLHEVENNGLDQKLVQELQKDARKYPHKYRQLPPAPSWTKEGAELQAMWPNVIMHLICLGVIRTTVEAIAKYLTATKKSSAFSRKCGPLLNPFAKMNIQWLKILPWKGCHWVSENYHGFGRLMPWFYQIIDTLIAEKKVTLPPEQDQKKWLKIHNQHWLQCRGISTEGNAKDLSQRVANKMKETPPPKLKEEPERPSVLVENVVVSLHNLLQCVFATSVTEEIIVQTEFSVRVYLTAIQELDDNVTEAVDKRFIFTHYNYASLIDVPDMMRRYGPLRQLWEGGPKGEGYFRIAKPLMKSGFNTANWHKNLMVRLTQNKSLDNIIPSESCTVSAPHSNEALKDRKQHFQSSESQLQFLNDLCEDADVPLSVVLIKANDGNVRICGVIGKSCEMVIEVEKKPLPPVQKFGFSYYKFDAAINDGQPTDWSELAPATTEIGYGVLLPLLTGRTDHDGHSRHVLIASNWKSLSPTVPIAELVDENSVSF
jgi:hypothetical protein